MVNALQVTVKELSATSGPLHSHLFWSKHFDASLPSTVLNYKALFKWVKIKEGLHLLEKKRKEVLSLRFQNPTHTRTSILVGAGLGPRTEHEYMCRWHPWGFRASVDCECSRCVTHWTVLPVSTLAWLGIIQKGKAHIHSILLELCDSI